MSTKATDARLDEVRRRIDGLEAGAQQAGAAAKQSMKRKIAELRQQEASARTAAHKPDASGTAEQGDPTKDKYLYLETRLGALETELAAEISRGPGEDQQRHGG